MRSWNTSHIYFFVNFSGRSESPIFRQKLTFRFHRPKSAMCPERSLDLLTQSFDNRDYPDSTTACVTGRYIDIEYSFQALRPGHGGMALHGRSLIAVYPAMGVLASFRRRHQRPVLAVWRKHAMESCQVSSRPGYQSCQACHKVQWPV